MKILTVCAQNYQKIGGIEKHVKEINEAFSHKGHEVTILYIDPKIKNTKEEKQGDITIIRCPGFAPKGNYHISLKLYRKIKELDYDILHCHGYNSATTIMGILANKKKGKCIMTFHGFGVGLWINNLVHVPYSRLMKLIKNKVDKFICVSNFEKELFSKRLKIPEDKFIILSNGVDFTEFNDLKNIKENKDKIIGIGRLEKFKGFQYLIRGFAEAHKSNKNLRLEILGKGSYKENLINLIKKLNLEKEIKIRFLPRDKMLKQLAGANTFVLLSKYEGQPVSVLEAMALNKKIILNYRTSLMEFVDRGNALGVKDVRNSGDIANKILKKIKVSPGNVMSWNEIANETLKVYKEALNGKDKRKTK